MRDRSTHAACAGRPRHAAPCSCTYPSSPATLPPQPPLASVLRRPSQAAYNTELKDWYAAYNKPIAVKDFLANYKGGFKEEYLLLLDADMLLRCPFLPEEFNITRGTAMAAEYNYMKVRGAAARVLACRRTLRDAIALGEWA